MKYDILATGKFKRDLVTAQKRGYDLLLLQEVVNLLALGHALPKNNRDHGLAGKWTGHRECHITPDWLLIYKVDGKALILTLTSPQLMPRAITR